MAYVDGFVLAVKKDRIEEYKKMAAKGRDVWMANGATSYVEAIADDVPYGELTSFPRAVQCADDEVVVFSYITYPDKETRDACNKVVMADPTMQMDMKDAPFDGKRMIFGGFAPFIQA